MTTLTVTKTTPPEWLLAFWKEIDDKTFGKGFECLVEDATCRLGVAEWNGREAIRENLRLHRHRVYSTPRRRRVLGRRVDQDLSRHRHDEARRQQQTYGKA